MDTVPALPGLDPAVPVRVPAGVDPAAVTVEWPGWWAEVVEYCRALQRAHPCDRWPLVGQNPAADSSLTLADRPALRSAVAALAEPAAQYQLGLPLQQPGRLPATELVAELKRELGRRARPFRLAITEVRVRGAVLPRSFQQ